MNYKGCTNSKKGYIILYINMTWGEATFWAVLVFLFGIPVAFQLSMVLLFFWLFLLSAILIWMLLINCWIEVLIFAPFLILGGMQFLR